MDDIFACFNSIVESLECTVRYFQATTYLPMAAWEEDHKQSANSPEDSLLITNLPSEISLFPNEVLHVLHSVV